MLLGAWAALIAFIGPYFNFAYTPDTTWHYTSDRLWMEILPGAGAFLGGLILLISAHRVVAMLGGALAALSGAWLATSLPLSAISGMPQATTPTGGTTRQVAETLGFFTGLGVVIVFVAAVAMGRFAVVGVREVRAAEEEEAADERWAMLEGYGSEAPFGMPGKQGAGDPSAPEAERLGGAGGARYGMGRGNEAGDATTAFGGPRSTTDESRSGQGAPRSETRLDRSPSAPTAAEQPMGTDGRAAPGYYEPGRRYQSDSDYGSTHQTYRTVDSGTQEAAEGGVPPQRSWSGSAGRSQDLPHIDNAPEAEDELMERIRQQAAHGGSSSRDPGY